MLESIKIFNLALIDKSSIDFADGFNVLTGETGAGKSLIVDALLFLTGIRADKTLIKSGEDFARVDGVFSIELDNQCINDILNSIGIDNEGTLLISRQFNVNGKNECRINGELVTLNIIRKLSSFIIDIFGQNDSQILLDSSNHLLLLDNIYENSLAEKKSELSNKLSILSEINHDISDLGGLDKDRENTIQLLQFQLDEINNAELYEMEEDELKAQILTMQNCEKIYTTLNNIGEFLDGEVSLENNIKSAINLLSSIESFDEDYTKQKDRLFTIRYELQDIVSEILNKKDSLIFSEDELDICQDRLALIKDLERKYGQTISDIFKFRDDIDIKLQKLLNADEELERLRLNKLNVLREIFNICSTLREIRKNNILNFSSKLLDELKELGMKNATFDVYFKNELSLDSIESIVDINGADDIEFLFSANLGVEPRPLNKIISGGEMSRFMLAFKSIQNVNTNKTCIFDEIDTGIGGEIGVVVGKKICKISQNCQVICITHLAQIASFADANFKIEKMEEDGKTHTCVRRIYDEERVFEIARMLGSSVNESSINHARGIIDENIAYKNFLKFN